MLAFEQATVAKGADRESRGEKPQLRYRDGERRHVFWVKGLFEG
jgi:hypothetical protein